MGGVWAREDVERWLLAAGFTPLPGGSSSHRHYRGPTGVKISLRGHGRKDMDRGTLSRIRKQLAAAGVDVTTFGRGAR